MTPGTLSEWFDRGVRHNARYMLVVRDDFSHEYYPSYFITREAALERLVRPGAMQCVVEAYDLAFDKKVQIEQYRNWRL